MNQNVTPQLTLFFDDIYQALMADIQALGGSKTVGSILWPSLKPDKAGEKVANCANRSHAQKFDLEDMLLIIREARKNGSYATAFFMASDTGFAEPQPIEPEDEKARLQTEFIQAVKAMERLSSKMDRINASD